MKMNKIVNDEGEIIDNLDLLPLFKAEKELCTRVNNGQDVYITDSDYILGTHYIEGIEQGFEAFHDGTMWNGGKVLLFNNDMVAEFLEVLNDSLEFKCTVNTKNIITIEHYSNGEIDTIKPNNMGYYSFDGWLFV